MPDSLLTAAYIAASALFILSLGGLSQQETARRGNSLGMAGMLIAVIATAIHIGLAGTSALSIALIPGAIIGAVLAARVAMESTPKQFLPGHSKWDWDYVMERDPEVVISARAASGA